ncbi:hypothetical protein DERP_001276 [Dermatophagoides pteronyssinus]|uniref:Uncharacterized protein n=1 Tax=Dermatophagoides pteronyssinus TaxID=6956 RepID=A0ABQ8JE12_DERPT|nr:hypothetical protein DERP_001276 [Dermatophagoides pteronyssinus]
MEHITYYLDSKRCCQVVRVFNVEFLGKTERLTGTDKFFKMLISSGNTNVNFYTEIFCLNVCINIRKSVDDLTS